MKHTHTHTYIYIYIQFHENYHAHVHICLADSFNGLSRSHLLLDILSSLSALNAGVNETQTSFDTQTSKPYVLSALHSVNTHSRTIPPQNKPNSLAQHLVSKIHITLKWTEALFSHFPRRYSAFRCSLNTS